MGDVIRRKLMFYSIGLFAVCVLLLLAMGSLFLAFHDDAMEERQIRIGLNGLLTKLEEGGVKQLSKEPFPYTIFGMDEMVLWDTTGKYREGEKVELDTLGGTKRYVVPVKMNGKTQVLLMADCSDVDTGMHRKLVVSIICLLVTGMLVFLFLLKRVYRMLERDFWEPLKQLQESTRKILAGNYQQTVFYDYKGQIGQLCHDFEKMRDSLSDSKKREQQMKEKERILYASLSHDLKTPLAIIQGYMEEIAYNVVTTGTEIKEVTELCLSKIQGIIRLTDDILAHSKAELGQLSIVHKEVYARQYFGKILQEQEADAEAAGYELFYELPPQVLLSLDPDRIAEVMQNLIGNAVKYRRKDLKISISFFMEETKPRMLIVEVKDNGIGIEAADLPFVFDLFYRGNKARTQDIPGSGLGLHITRYIVEQHGGRIECDSIVGVGTTMSFSLPVL